MKFPILKTHGSYNDFILIDEYSTDYGLNDEKRTQLTKALCDRSTTLGADGILFVQKSDQADARMRIFNADGTEPEMCGNGLRCASRYITELLSTQQATVETLKANLPVKQTESLYENIPTFEVLIDPVSFDVSTLPVIHDKSTLINTTIPELSPHLLFTAVSMPNPHIVTIVDEINEQDVQEIGEKANNLKSVFPKGVNVSFVKRIGSQQIFVQTYERGVGITNSCGTAMSASSLITCILHMNDASQDVTVLNNGGMVRCKVNTTADGYTVSLKGNATYVYKGTVTLDFSTLPSFTFEQEETFTAEDQQYKELELYAKKALQQS
ncbi:diaminopimelate epimerase [Fictibacillus macauensis ZFHKF-1]|uniref:Diaminopimelate epimerase n=1 Tax=Fictibacillus macauensis ZFHKF-1 TaxID=1196324 RepID=I8UGH4_9BACL|nr:diaminopimelate epimerase [Fictibacillus macauensis]EIT85965.1 diaminopimelate epimerase [Fictibacillus macauensis ZFHKF-1]